MALDDDSTGSTGPSDKKDTPAQKKQVKNEHVLIVVAVVTLIAIVVYSRRQAAAASSSTQAATSTTPYNYASDPSSQYGGGSSDNPYYDQQLQTIAQDMQTMQNEIVGLTPPTTGGSSGTGTTLPVSGTTTGPGFGIADVAGLGQMIDLGTVGAGDLDYNVGGGAPVYFGQAGTGAQQGSQNQHAGDHIFTPVSQAGEVSTTATPSGFHG